MRKERESWGEERERGRRERERGEKEGEEGERERERERDVCVCGNGRSHYTHHNICQPKQTHTCTQTTIIVLCAWKQTTAPCS